MSTGGFVIVEVNQASHGWSVATREVFDVYEEARSEAAHMQAETSTVGRQKRFYVAGLEVGLDLAATEVAS